ncbi:FAD-dependent oxidoreductase [Rhizobium sp. LARHSG275]|uniref:FAD-dependent oxidoreductase n=1 Tax=Rhizobium TaxID=379 RepID=UPI00138949CD|nr:FAD-dependent oxidoreductase [Rhizobium laguerreae]NDK49153.1 FAD-dependent oxidoreductase [Rhizobium laguerreae]
MAVDFKYIVVGRGLMGAAAARHLARQVDGVAVIGPDEPDDRKAHQGVFASHYDEGRITRTIDPDRNWALLANRSIGRYGEIARDSGIDFYREVGCAVVAPTQSDYLERTRQAAISLGVETRTVTLFEVSEADAARLAAMPSLILRAPGIEIYLLPPIRYPDGKFYLKIGGDPDDMALSDDADMRAWFKTEGRDTVRAHLKRIVEGLVPDIVPLSISTAACVVSHTERGYPMIGYTSSPEIAVLTGCAGTWAKSSDEIGRLGAELLLSGGIGGQGYSTDFTPQFR